MPAPSKIASTLKPVVQASRLFSATKPPFTRKNRKNTLFRPQILTFKSQLWCKTVPQFHCDLRRLSCKTQKHRNTWLKNKSLSCSGSNAPSSTASAEKERKSPGSLASNSKAVRERFDSNATNPVAQARQLSPQRNPFTWKNTQFRPNPNIQNTSLSSPTATCNDWVAKHKSIATHDLSRFVAAVPMHKVPQHTQTQPRKKVSHLEASLPIVFSKKHNVSYKS